jgi:DNA replication protein DnaC
VTAPIAPPSLTLHGTLERLHTLRLPGMATAFSEQLQSSAAAELPFEERLALLLEREMTYRDDRRLQRLLQEARLALPAAAAEDIDFRAPRGLDRSVVLRLVSAEWVRHHQVALIVGPTGAGKSYLACALGQAACRHGFTTRYFRLGRLLHALALARADGSYPKMLIKLAKTDLLILDDWGLAPLGDPERRDLLEVLEDRYRKRATLVTSQLPVEHWHEYIGNATLADAILDRLVHGAHVITAKGGSMRKRLAAAETSTPNRPS